MNNVISQGIAIEKDPYNHYDRVLSKRADRNIKSF